ncbi:MAG: transposase, partial [Halobacteria archaeon]|nr:transposase [Halobacteria archaeon]
HPEPSPPSTDKNSAYPLVLAHGEGYRLWQKDDSRIGFRISAKPRKQVRGFLRGRHSDLELLREALKEDNDEYSLGQAEVLYREGVYYLHVPIQYEADVREKENSETVIGVDINERNVALTALDRDSMDAKGTLVLDYGSVKHVRQKLHDIRRRCQEHHKTSVRNRFSDKEEGYTNWVLHRISRAIVEFAQEFEKPLIVFEDMTDIRDSIEYGSYMNRRLHKLPFRTLQDMAEYKANWDEIPTTVVDAYHNSKTCSCCGERGSRKSRRFTCTNANCKLNQDHADRNASVNVAWRGIQKIKDRVSSDYRTRKTPPRVRKVSLCGSGRHVNRPTSSTDIASVGVLS